MLFSQVLVHVALIGSVIAPIAEPTKFIKSFTKGESEKYAVAVEMKGMGDMRFSFDVTTKVVSTLDAGKADIEFSAGKIDASVDSASGMTPPQPKPSKIILDSRGFPEQLETSEDSFAYIFLILGGVTPNQDLSSGEKFDVKWKGTKREDKIEGAGTFVAIEELEGQKVANFKYDLRVMPANEGPAGGLTLTNWILPSTGKLIKAEGRMALDSDGKFYMTFTIKPKK